MGLNKRDEEQRDNALREYLESGGRIERLPEGPEHRVPWTRLKPRNSPWLENRHRFLRILRRRKAWLKAELAGVENQLERMQRSDWRPDQADRAIEKKERRRLNGRRKKRRR